MDIISYTGTINFDLKDVTNKHKVQSSWKKTAFVMFDGDIAEYYGWFLKRRYSIALNKPLRGAHISFINDSVRDIDGLHLWEDLKNKYEGTSIQVELNLDPRTDAKHWWLNVTDSSVAKLQAIRSEVGLKEPYFRPHMTIGSVNEINYAHSQYIHRLLTKQTFPAYGARSGNGPHSSEGEDSDNCRSI